MFGNEGVLRYVRDSLLRCGMTERLVLHGGGKRGGASTEQIDSTDCRRVFRLPLLANSPSFRSEARNLKQ